jgi:hypothetical protein
MPLIILLIWITCPSLSSAHYIFAHKPFLDPFIYQILPLLEHLYSLTASTKNDSDFVYHTYSTFLFFKSVRIICTKGFCCDLSIHVYIYSLCVSFLSVPPLSFQF